MLTFLMMQTEGMENYEYIYNSIGHFTKDEDAVITLLSNLFALMSERAEWLGSQQKKLCLKLAFRFINLFYSDELKVRIF